MPTLFIPPLDLNPTCDEVDFIDKTIKSMSEEVKKRFVSRLPKPFKVNDDKEASAELDKVIEVGVDTLRPVIKEDFIEKLYARLHHLCEYDDDIGSHGMLTMRLMDSIKYVIVHTKKFRGAIREPAVDKATARTELTKRGLWKK